MIRKIYKFPVSISTDFASETAMGPVPPLSTVVDLYASGMVGYNNIISTSGVYDAIQGNLKENKISIINQGGAEQVAFLENEVDIKIKKIKVESNRISIQEPIDDGLILNFNNADIFPVIESKHIQGGVYQMETNFNLNDNFDFTQKEILSGCSAVSNIIIPSGIQSDISIPILANVYGSSEWNSNISIDKIGIRIPSGTPFINDGERISLGTPEDPEKFGHFSTRKLESIMLSGEWLHFQYSEEMLEKGFSFFFNESEIVATTQTSINITNNNTNKLYPQFKVRVFFDKVYFRPIKNFKGYMLGTGSTQGIMFDNESSFILNVGVKVKRDFGTGLSNEFRGLCFGGLLPEHILSDVIDGIVFETDTEMTSQVILSQKISSMIGVYSHYGRGYLLGGNNNKTGINTVTNYNFLNDTITHNFTLLSDSLMLGAGIMGLHAGYTLGGENGYGEIKKSINKMDFYTDNISHLSIQLSNPTYDNTGISAPEIGYTLGGDINTSSVNRIDGLKYADETVEIVSSILTSIKSLGGGVFSQTEGYYLGGNETSFQQTTTIDKFDFSTETCNSIYSSLFYQNDDDSNKASAQYYPKVEKVGFPYTFPQILT